MFNRWKKKGILITKENNTPWLYGGSGPACVDVSTIDKKGNIDIFVSGRNKNNQSEIGKININIERNQINHLKSNSEIELGELGLFDYSGTSYPHLVDIGGDVKYLYYTGWFLGKDVPFINDLGLAISTESQFKKISKATILPRTNNEPYGIGSVFVIKESPKLWKIWYTCFERWGESENDEKHYYHIKYAESKDGINWNRLNKVAVSFNIDKGEYVAAKPSVIKYKDYYFMWYSYRGLRYRIGFAYSIDGINWKRKDEWVGIDCSETGWDSEMICYAHVFIYNLKLVMLYNGNGFGKDGLGIATIQLSYLDEVISMIKNE